MKARMAVTGVAVLGMALTACGESPKASGLVDGDTKYTAAVRAVAAKTHTVSGTKKERYCSRSVKGVCKSYSERTVPDNKVVTDAPAKPGKSAKYCVQLDDVNGHKDDDDVWFNVSGTTYADYKLKDEGNSLKDMKYNHKGC